MLAWLAAASAPTDTTGRGKTFSCSSEPAPIHLGTNDPKRILEEDFVAPMGYRYWALKGADYAAPGDTATVRPLRGSIVFEGGESGSGFGLRARYSYTNTKGESLGPEEVRPFWVYYPGALAGGGMQFEGVPIEVVAKAASADTLGLLLRGTSGALEHEYHIHISGRLGRGSLECRQRPPGGAWATRLRLDFTR